jgi:hypothetical protein
MPASLEKMPLFHGDNAIGAKEQWDAFIDHIITLGVCYFDMIYKNNSLSLKKYARKWFIALPNNSITSFEACQNIFFNRWLENKDRLFLFNSLNNIKINENDTIDEFNNRFDNIV